MKMSEIRTNTRMKEESRKQNKNERNKIRMKDKARIKETKQE